MFIKILFILELIIFGIGFFIQTFRILELKKTKKLVADKIESLEASLRKNKIELDLLRDGEEYYKESYNRVFSWYINLKANYPTLYNIFKNNCSIKTVSAAHEVSISIEEEDKDYHHQLNFVVPKEKALQLSKKLKKASYSKN